MLAPIETIVDVRAVPEPEPGSAPLIVETVRVEREIPLATIVDPNRVEPNSVDTAMVLAPSDETVVFIICIPDDPTVKIEPVGARTPGAVYIKVLRRVK